MSKDFPKNTEKRSRSTSNDTNNSFVKNVTSRMSGLSATISKWFSNPSTANSNGSAPTADATDSSTEDEAPDAPVTQPPAKRMRYSPSGKGNHYNASDGNQNYSVSGNVETLEPNLYTAVQSTPDPSTFRRDYVTPLPSTSEESTSEWDVIMLKSQASKSSVRPSVATKRKSLFDSPSRINESVNACATTPCNTIRDPKEPCFKPSLLGSPFYPGRTTYGGASTSYINHPNIRNRKNAVVNQMSTENNAISYSARRVMDLLEDYSSPLNEARRIPQYERTARSRYSDPSHFNINPISYKTQELHVPSIASILQLKKRSRLMDTTTVARQLIASHSSTLGFNPPPYPVRAKTREENPSSDLTTKLKVRMTRQNRGEASDNEAMPIPVELPSAVLQIDKDQLPKFSFGTQSGSTLPTSTPRLFTRIETKAQVIETSTMSMITETPLRKPETVSNDILYKFSSPVTISSDSSRESYIPVKFIFGSPERSVDRANVNEEIYHSCVVGKQKEMDIKDWQCPTCWVANKPDVYVCVCCEGNKPPRGSEKPKCAVCKRGDTQPHCSCAPKAKPTSTTTADYTKWKCEDCWVNNDVSVDSCVCCGGKRRNSAPATPISMIVPIPINYDESDWKCDVCLIKNKSHIESCAACAASKPNNNFKTTLSPIAVNYVEGEWKCDVCLIKNKSNVETCAACAAPKPKNNCKTTLSPIPINYVEGEWNCDVCLIKNKSNVETCAACAAPKPNKIKKFPISLSISVFDSSKAPDRKFQNIVNSRTDKWDCPCCLVSNDVKKSKCICCETVQPGTMKESEHKSFNFGVNTSFKFGIDPKLQEVHTFELASDKSKVEESETNNNVLSTTPSFTFGLPPKKSEDKTDTSKKVGENAVCAPKMNFSFGIPKCSVEPLPVASVCATVPKLSETVPKIIVSETEKPQEVPKIDFSIAKAQETSKPIPNFSARPLATAAAQDNTTDSSNSTNALETKETTGNVLSLPVVATSTEAMPQPTFTFTTTGGNLGSLFPAPATTAAAVSIPFAPKVTQSSSSTINMFQKGEPTTTSTVAIFNSEPASSSVFSKGETITVTHQPPGVGTFLFNFGSNTQPTAQPKSEKPKFNFSFGNNNSTDTNAMYKVNFGATDNNANKFSLSTVSAIGPGTTPGVSAGNHTVGNELPAIPLGGSEPKPLSTASSLPATSSIFGAAIPKETLWSSNNNNNTNLFVTSALTNNNNNNNMFVSNSTNSPQNPVQKAFSFGNTPFNAPNAAPFGSNTLPTPSFGSNSLAPPAFGTNSQPAPNVFGLPNQNSNNQTLFLSAAPSQGATNIFGGPASNPAPALGMFGPPSVPVASFGAPNASLPPFETPSLAPAPAPAFNFGTAQPSVFGFGQQQQQQPVPQPQTAASGVYSFGSVPGASPQVQFNMGSAPNTAMRRMRKAVRRNPQR